MGVIVLLGLNLDTGITADVKTVM